MKKKGRQANFELLRIIAMLMVMSLHYMNHGQVAVPLDEGSGAVNSLACLLKELCIVCVNVYVLISGYFLVDSRWSLFKLVRLVVQIWLYSVTIPVVCLLLGIGKVAEWTLYDWANVLLPLQMEHYWFATAYVILFLLMPVLGSAVKQMSKKQLETVIVLLLLFFSVAKSVLPILIPIDKYGYDFGWLICVFLIAAYIRLYGLAFFTRKRQALLCYFALGGILWLENVIFAFLTGKGLPFGYMADMTLSLNHIFVLAASVALFYVFAYLQLPENPVTRLICKIAPYTFGVYLFHENLAIREIWPYWFGVEKVQGSFFFVPHMLGTVLAMFLAGVMIDFVRDCLMKVLTRAVTDRYAGKPVKRRN